MNVDPSRLVQAPIGTRSPHPPSSRPPNKQQCPPQPTTHIIPTVPVIQRPNTRSPSPVLTNLYTIAHLILFSQLGTLARLGVQASTSYSGAPSTLPVLWTNAGGCFVMGFLVEDKPGLWREWQSGAATAATAGVVSSGTADAVGPDKEIHTEPGGDLHGPTTVMRTAQQRSAALRRKIPLYVGLTTGFCGSFTSFSAFARDIFLALANGLPSPVYHEPPTLSSPDSRAPAMSQQLAGRNGGYSVAAVLAVLILTVSLSLSALSFGKHIALLLSDRRWTASVSERFVTRILDPLTVFLALGCWIGAVMMAAFPPYDEWRGQALFAVILAPLGCLIRYYLAVYLNAGVAGFPMGTFVANVSGTLMLGVMYDLQHASIGGVIGCQMLQGVQDGFCGCLTTVSTWAAELKSLRRRQAYVYGLCSVGVSWALLIIVMGSLKWSGGFRQKSC